MIIRRVASLIGTSLFLFLASAAAQTGEPQRFLVLDGDTVELDGRVIDLAGIDAPEFGQVCRRGGTDVDCGMIARTQLLDLTAASEIECDLDRAVTRAGWPTVAVCRASGYDLSEGMLHTGWALSAQAGNASATYQAVADAAREAGRGLWGFAFVAPWEWRRGGRLPK